VRPVTLKKIAKTLELLRVQVSVFQKIKQQQLMGILKKASHKIANFRSGRFLSSDQRLINVRPTVLEMLYVSLFFQNANGGQDRVISQSWLAFQGLQKLVDRTWTFLPEDFHQPQFSFGQSGRFSRRQCTYLSLCGRPFY